MRKYKTLFSFSFRKYGDFAGVYRDRCKMPICLGAGESPSDMAEYCRSLAAYLLEMSHNYDNAKDFTFPKFDHEHREKQLDKLREIMNIF